MTKRGDNLKEKDLDDILYESTLPKQARTVFCESANLSAAQRYRNGIPRHRNYEFQEFTDKLFIQSVYFFTFPIKSNCLVVWFNPRSAFPADIGHRYYTSSALDGLIRRANIRVIDVVNVDINR